MFVKLWDKGYNLDRQVEAFTVGNDHIIDRRLVKYDCIASKAHADMLCYLGYITKKECNSLIKALDEIIKLDLCGKFTIHIADEDCHTAIENYLVKRLGQIGRKIHTSRSRNDQVLVALRLYYRDNISGIDKSISCLTGALIGLKKRYGKVVLPGYTHMRKAMPSSVGLWAGSFIESMNDNRRLLRHVSRLIDQSPLGTGAGYGLPVHVDRKHTAKLMRFRKVQHNPIYVQNSRGKFESSILHALNQVMLDLNRMASDLLLFSMPEFGYFILPQELCTGSSLMPHKNNPDVLELVRAKYHQTLSYEFKVKSIVGNIFSGYNRDLQLTKEPVIMAFETTTDCLGIVALVIDKIKVNRSRCMNAMTIELNSVKEVHRLISKNVPFRNAYQKVATRYKKIK